MLDELYWYFKVGKPKRRLTAYQIREELNTYIKEPVFFLSTGRCGTKWFSDLLAKDRDLAVFHAPLPNLAVPGKTAWSISKTNNFDLPDNEFLLLKEIFLAGREQHLRYTAKAQKRYVETNNYITFFAPVLAKIFPDAKFVHIVRDPVSFIRSGMDRSYYLPGNTDDVKRIVPVTDIGGKNWDSLSKYAKVAWLWKETNAFIDSFYATLPSSRIMLFPFNLSNPAGVVEVMEFIGSNISGKQVKAMLSKKKNVQRSRSCPPYSEWQQEYKEEVKLVIGDLAAKYNL